MRGINSMEKIVKVTYKVPVVEYSNHGWRGTAELSNNELECFEKAALMELLSRDILRTIIDDYIEHSGEIHEKDWETMADDIKFLLKKDEIISELFPVVEFGDVERDENNAVGIFSIILSKYINPTALEHIYFRFEY